MNFTPYYSWHDYYNHYSSEGEKWEAIGGASVRTNTKQFSWQIDNIIRWKREFAQKHKVEVTLLANAEKAQYWSTTAEAQGYTPNDVLGYHQLQSGSVQKVSSDDTYQTGDALMARLFYSLCRSAALLPLSPLRTVRATFTAYSSDNSKFNSHKIKSAHNHLAMTYLR